MCRKSHGGVWRVSTRGAVKSGSEVGLKIMVKLHRIGPARTRTKSGFRWPLLLWPVLFGMAANSAATAQQNRQPGTASPPPPAASFARSPQSSTATRMPPRRQARRPVTGIRALSAQRQVDLAFDAVFGQGEREARTQQGMVYSYANGRVVWVGTTPFLIVEGTAEAWPQSYGALGIFLLSEHRDGRLQEMARWPDAVMGSMMGNPPRWRVRDDITDRPVIESTGGGAWQGYACDTTTLTELTPDGPHSIGVIDMSYDSTGALGDQGKTYRGSISNVVRNRSFDVQFTGTQRIMQHFIRRDVQFLRVPEADDEVGESVIPTC